MMSVLMRMRAELLFLGICVSASAMLALMKVI